MRPGWVFLTLAALFTFADAVGAAEKEGDPFALRVDLALWSIVVFLGLYFVLRKFAWGHILEGMQKREETIRAAVEEAHRARAENDRARADFERKLAEAHAEIPELLEDARRDAQRLSDEMRARAQADIQAERQRLRRELDVAHDQALQDLWQQTAQLATLISAKAIRREVSADDHRRLVDEALAELRAAAEKRRGGR